MILFDEESLCALRSIAVDTEQRTLIVRAECAIRARWASRKTLIKGASSVEIYLEKAAVRQIRTSIEEAIEVGDYETLREDLIEAFTDDDIEEIERRIDSGDFFDFITDILDEWSGEDASELFELIEQQLTDVGIDLKFALDDDEEDEEDDLDADDLDDELDFDDPDGDL